MGEPIKIADLARKMVHLSGLEVVDSIGHGDIEIQYTGLRPGEKLYEELLIGDNVSLTKHQKIMRAEEHIIPWVTLEPILDQLQDAIKHADHQRVRNLLLKHIDGFAPQCDIEDWLKVWQGLPHKPHGLANV